MISFITENERPVVVVETRWAIKDESVYQQDKRHSTYLFPLDLNIAQETLTNMQILEKSCISFIILQLEFQKALYKSTYILTIEWFTAISWIKPGLGEEVHCLHTDPTIYLLHLNVYCCIKNFHSIAILQHSLIMWSLWAPCTIACIHIKYVNFYFAHKVLLHI